MNPLYTIHLPLDFFAPAELAAALPLRLPLPFPVALAFAFAAPVAIALDWRFGLTLHRYVFRYIKTNQKLPYITYIDIRPLVLLPAEIAVNKNRK